MQAATVTAALQSPAVVRRSHVAPSLRCSMMARPHAFAAPVRQQQQQQRAIAMRAFGEKEEAVEEAVVQEEQQDFEEEWEEEEESFQERVVQIRRVTKVVKGGKKLSFRAVVVVGDENGTVGVGCDSAGEVIQAVRKAAVGAKRNLITVPLNKNKSFPHRFDGRFGAAKVMLRPAAEGTGVIAGGAVRAVLELAGVRNGFAKQLGTDNPLNNARACIEGLASMRTFQEVAEMRGLPVSHVMGRS